MDRWLVGWLDGWLVGWLDEWLVGWLVCSLDVQLLFATVLGKKMNLPIHDIRIVTRSYLLNNGFIPITELFFCKQQPFKTFTLQQNSKIFSPPHFGKGTC